MSGEKKVGIILGSISDIEQAKKAGTILKELKIPYEVTIASAHRTPGDVKSYSEKAVVRGIGVIIAVAGLSAALPGVVAAHTLLPVIGVPVSAGSLGGMDALLSITQMPPGIPVSSVGIDNGRNGALLAARILAISDETISSRLASYMEKQSEKGIGSRQEIGDLPSAPEDAF